MQTPAGRSFKTATLCAVWLLAVVAGSVAVWRYENAAGSVGTAPDSWPTGTPLVLDRERNTLVLFAHPQCPCTRASMEELSRIMARSDGRLVAHVAFLSPRGMPADWVRTDLWRTASGISGVDAHEDPDGAISRRFGAETSGTVVLYSPRGQLLFRGGITGSRGHSGDNAGESAILALLRGENPGTASTPAYGCSLMDSCEGPAQTSGGFAR